MPAIKNFGSSIQEYSGPEPKMVWNQARRSPMRFVGTFPGLVIVSTMSLFQTAATAQTCNNLTQCVNVVQNGNGSGMFVQAPNGGSGVDILIGGSGFGLQSRANAGTAISATAVTGVAIHGQVTAANGAANAIEGIATGGNGVYAVTNAVWPKAAVYGVSGSTGAGIRGDAGASTGVVGHATNTGTGVYGEVLGSSGYGMFGFSNGSGGYGVYGLNTSTGYAVYASGQAGGTTGWAVTSDARLKRDVKNLPYGLAEILKLRPVTYRLKEGYTDTQLGLIAQEVKTILPDVVRVDATSGILSLNYTALIPVVIQAIQDQQKIIEKQQKAIEQQDSRISKLQGGRSPLMLSAFSERVEMGVVLGGLPIGLLVLSRRRKNSRS
jgi:hypothetical protein